MITVERFGPLFVAMDSKGNSAFKNITDKAKKKRDQWKIIFLKVAIKQVKDVACQS